MVHFQRKSAPPHRSRNQDSRGRGISLLVFLPLSLLLHALVFIILAQIPQGKDSKKREDTTTIVTFKAIPKPAPKPQEAPRPEDAQKILETPLTKTEAPETADYLGQQNHRALKEQKIAKDKRIITENKDPGPLKKQMPGKPDKPLEKEFKNELTKTPSSTNREEEKARNKMLSHLKRKYLPKARNHYERLLQQGSMLMQDSAENQGYQDHIEGKMAEGDYIDLNTQEYRYIGYFTNMRKAIELAWNYPASAAANGIYGKVGISFTILKDGRVCNVEVVNSSGYQILDLAIVDAIKEAAPFAPLPDGFKKKNLNISGTFSYILH